MSGCFQNWGGRISPIFHIGRYHGNLKNRMIGKSQGEYGMEQIPVGTFPSAGGEKEIEKRNQCVRMRTELGADTAWTTIWTAGLTVFCTIWL